jgi:quinolinate synthase
MGLKEKISELKERKHAVILAHNYQVPEIQEVADFVGDSLELALKSSRVEDAKLIVFSGVDFMAEMASILNPDKKVVVPDPAATCPMASMLPRSLLRKAREENPNAVAVLYVNTLAEAKAECDVVCTSANAPQVVEALESEEILFGPDRNLARFVARRTGKKIVPVPADGHCYVHRMFKVEEILNLKKRFPDAEVLIHPECEPEVQDIASHLCSTSQMLARAKASPCRRFIVATEVGMVERLKRDCPDREFIPALPSAICREMKLNTLEKLYLALRDEKYVVRVPPPVAEKARKAIEKMMEISGRATRD